MKKGLLVFIAVLFSPFVFSQGKLLTMDEVVLNGRTTLVPAKLQGLKWIKGTDFYSYTDTMGTDKVMKGMLSSKSTLLFTLPELNRAMARIQADTFKTVPELKWNDYQSVFVESKMKRYLFNLLTKTTELKSDLNTGDNSEHQDEHEASGAIAFTVENNLFILKDGLKIQVTDDVEKNIVNGQSVHREEFGIFKGTFWSPTGRYLAFYRMDQTMVTDYPMMDLSQRPAKGSFIKYPMAGDRSHEVTIGIFDLATRKKIFLKTGEPRDQYLTNICWSPDEKSLYVAVLNRGQDHLQLNRYAIQSGELEKTLFEERHPKYVQPLHPVEFVPGLPDQLIWQSRRDGWNHLYLYKTDGTLLRQLTSGPWEVTDVVSFSDDGKYIFCMTTESSPLNRDLYKVEIKNGLRQRLTSSNGTHTIQFNDKKTYFIDNFSSLEVPRKISICTVAGREMKQILNAPDPLADYRKGDVKVFSIKSNSGDDLYCRLFTPAAFDAPKKFPAIVYVYNGPGIQLITNSWMGGADLWFQYMAQRGFVVFTVEGHGTPFRGAEFEQQTFGRLGTLELEDQLAGVRYLKSLAYVDSTRLGIYGWSYGGFMTTGMVTRHPGVFKAAVAGGPVIDWKYYEVMYTERYMNTPEENPSGYEESSLLNYAGNLSGKLLLIHGTADDVVVWQHSLMFLKKCVDMGKQVDYFVYPGHPHNVRGKDRIHLLTKISNYFFDNL